MSAMCETNYGSEFGMSECSYPVLDDLIQEVRVWLSKRENGMYDTSDLDDEDIMLMYDCGLRDVIDVPEHENVEEFVGEKKIKGELARNRFLLEKNKKLAKSKMYKKTKGQQRESKRQKERNIVQRRKYM
jgi:hypothetical protein